MAATNSCVLFLFQDWNLDSESKYGFACLGAFLMVLTFTLIKLARKRLGLYIAAKEASVGRGMMVALDAANAFTFASQMLISYWYDLFSVVWLCVWFVMWLCVM